MSIKSFLHVLDLINPWQEYQYSTILIDSVKIQYQISRSFVCFLLNCSFLLGH